MKHENLPRSLWVVKPGTHSGSSGQLPWWSRLQGLKRRLWRLLLLRLRRSVSTQSFSPLAWCLTQLTGTHRTRTLWGWHGKGVPGARQPDLQAGAQSRPAMPQAILQGEGAAGRQRGSAGGCRPHMLPMDQGVRERVAWGLPTLAVSKAAFPSGCAPPQGEQELCLCISADVVWAPS